jgi:hypothetical protein
MQAFDAEGRLGGLGMPTLILHGTEVFIGRNA